LAGVSRALRVGDQLIRAMVEARREVDCQLAVAGDRPQYFAVARRIAAEVGLDANALHVLGWLEGDQLDIAFAACDVVATPSVYPDPFNLMNVRAMAHARPVVGTLLRRNSGDRRARRDRSYRRSMAAA